jgi:hypothetical protein
MEAATRENGRSLPGFVRVDELIGQPQFVAEFKAGWFLRQKGVWSCLCDEIANAVGDDLAAPVRSGVDYRATDRDTGGGCLFAQGKGSRET